MKIGILTTFDEINPCAYLQAYALQFFLKERGYQNYLINYKSFKYYCYEMKIYLCQKNPIRLFENIRKILRFKSLHKELKKTKFTFWLEDVNREEFDIIILGSDEIWNFKNCIGVADPAYYSVGLKAKKFIAYAPSFGNVDEMMEIPEYVIEGIKNINHISVRDINSLNILKNKLGISARLVLDPTFLYDFDRVLEEPRYSNYILVYGFFDEYTMNNIKLFSREIGLPIISVFYPNRESDLNVNVISPLQWIGFIKNASYIITNMYHGLIFSLKYRKNFATQITPYRKNKLDTLIKLFKLEQRVFNKDENVFIGEIFKTELNYSEILEKIGVYKRDSVNFLLEAIND